MLTSPFDSDSQTTLSYYTSDSVSEFPLPTEDAIASNTTITHIHHGIASETAIGHHSSDDYTLQSHPTNKSKHIQLTDQTNLLPFKKLVVVFFGLACCIVTTTLDSTIVATALPTISSYYNAGSISSWVPSATLLTSTAFQPLYGRFSDIFGRKVTLCVAMSVFMIGNLASGFSRSILELIIWRAIGGAGGGGITTLAQVVMSDVVSLRERGKYQGIIGSVVAFGYAVGPLMGGFMAQRVSWRWCFWITIPISALATCLVIFTLPLKPVGGDMKSRLLVVDYPGCILTLVGVTLLQLPLIWGGVTYPWSSAQVVATLLSGFYVLSYFCIWEWKGAKLPLVPMHIFRNRTVSGVYLTMFINGFIFWGSLFYIPQFFQVALGYSPIHSGVFLLPLMVTHTVTAFLTGVTVSKTGRYRMIVYCGFAIWAISCGCMSTLNPTKPKVEHVIFMILAGFGAGQTQQTTTVAAQASVPRSEMSVVTAMRNFVRYIGGTLALAVGSSVINNSMLSAARATTVPASVLHRITQDPSLLSHSSLSALNMTATEHADILAGYIHGFRVMFILYAALAAVAAVIAYYMIEHKDLVREDDAERRKQALREEAERRQKGVDKGSVTQVDKRAVTEMEMEVGLGKWPGRGMIETGQGSGKGVEWEGERGIEKGSVLQIERVEKVKGKGVVERVHERGMEMGGVFQIERAERETQKARGKGVERGVEKRIEKGNVLRIERVEGERGKGMDMFRIERVEGERGKGMGRGNEKRIEMGNVLRVQRVERQHTVRRSPLDGS